MEIETSNMLVPQYIARNIITSPLLTSPIRFRTRRTNAPPQITQLSVVNEFDDHNRSSLLRLTPKLTEDSVSDAKAIPTTTATAALPPVEWTDNCNSGVATDGNIINAVESIVGDRNEDDGDRWKMPDSSSMGNKNLDYFLSGSTGDSNDKKATSESTSYQSSTDGDACDCFKPRSEDASAVLAAIDHFLFEEDNCAARSEQFESEIDFNRTASSTSSFATSSIQSINVDQLDYGWIPSESAKRCVEWSVDVTFGDS
ncbi:hypothetical protein ACOME3_001244 [Neoechinorhynchus agilis]